MKIYTKTGDKGSTSLIGGERVKKNNPRVAAYGTADELMAFLGHLHDELLCYEQLGEQRKQLVVILRTLMDVAQNLATGDDSSYPAPQITLESIAQLEGWIDDYTKTLPALSDFTLPCGHPLLSSSHIARTIARRLEREILSLESVDDSLLCYVNRLSDYLYILGRKFTQEFNVKEILRNA